MKLPFGGLEPRCAAARGSPVSIVIAAAAMSLGVSRLPSGTVATMCGSGAPLTSIALQSNRLVELGAGGLRDLLFAPLDSSRRAKPAIVALRSAWAAAMRACARMPAARRLVTKATISSTITVTTSVARSMRKVWTGAVKKKL